MPKSHFFFHCPASYFCFVVSKGKFIKTKVTEKRQTVRLAKQGAACLAVVTPAAVLPSFGFVCVFVACWCSEALLGVSSVHPVTEQMCSKCDSSERCRRSLPAAPEGWQSPALPFPPQSCCQVARDASAAIPAAATSFFFSGIWIISTATN